MGGAAPKPKQDEFLPHPVKEQLPGVAYCMTSPPPWPEALLLGFQHYLVMLGSWDNCSHTNLSIIVSQMGGGNEEKAKMIQTLYSDLVAFGLMLQEVRSSIPCP
ncbi:hypothetical protein V6N12_060254 [Hibiscus sabdariffa]|uniref:Uncharacterized protein n=1 Tax=Hibiscus sabdariffa TaxID=183260 RepID=A0ABR2D3W2_9ROSI